MGKILLVAGHGQGDSGAGGGGYNEATTMRELVGKIKAMIPDVVDVYDTRLDCYQQNGLANTIYKNVIEFHMDGAVNQNAHGGHVIISSSFSPDTLDIALKNAISNHIGIWAGCPDGFSKRNDLQNLNVAANRSIAYRLLELGFITNSGDRDRTIGNMDVLAKKLAEAINNKSMSAPSQPTSKPQTSKPIGKSIDQLADEVIRGQHGTGDARRKSLGNQYDAVQKRVNEKLGVPNIASNKKSIDTIAREVIRGEWGNGQNRFNRLNRAGYDANAVQQRVNQLI